MFCIHHNDLDGYCAAAIVRFFTGYQEPELYQEMDYNTPWPINKIQETDTVYIVDFSVTEATLPDLMKVIEKAAAVVWIDHHESSVRIMEAHPELKDMVDGIVDRNYSGAALTYMYLHRVPYSKIPQFIKHVSDFDTFQLKDPNSMRFKYGVECEDYTPFAPIWAELFYDGEAGVLSSMRHCIQKGTYIEQYELHRNNKIAKEAAFESTFEGHPCICLNSNGNSSAFGDLFYRYPLSVLFHYDGKIQKYVYSIYSHKEKVNCSKLAEKYGGGGHPGAAGFSSPKLLVK